MKYFLPDCQDFVDPSFDFEREDRSIQRVRQRDDQYAHEVFSLQPYDGLLVSNGIVDGFGGSSKKYTMAQRHRLMRIGAREFLRAGAPDIPIMGDCGAFTYVKEKVPPYTVDEVLRFYAECEFDLGISVDHVILTYQPKYDQFSQPSDVVPIELRERQQITLEMADEFLRGHKGMGLTFTPLGVAQGWSPQSYAHSVRLLQDMGYTYIALGGMVPLKTPDILSCLEAISKVRSPDTKIHLLGVTRIEHVSWFSRYGVVSFDSTAPLVQAFKDDKDNYYTPDRTYTAVRVPQMEGNPDLQRLISSGKVSQDLARRLEKAALEALRLYDAGELSLEQTLTAITEYDYLREPKKDLREAYRQVLRDRPWTQCPCDVCQRLGYHVIIYRGAERNRRRGFHNIWVFYRQLQREFDAASNNFMGLEAVQA
jgi:hypothetical protein